MMINYKVRNSYSQLIPQQHLSSSSSSTFNQNTTSRNISSTLRMVAASLYLPKDDESNPRGEDAHFICSNQQTIGVADGVGGWAATNTGISGGDYARELMANCVKSLVGSVHVDPERVLNEAYSNTRVQGSSTACIISLIQDGGNNKNILRVYNVGDSGFILIREGKCVYKSQTQQRGFNCPYQLGITRDSPRCGEKMEVEVREGDLLIAGTDGLFDNMHIWEIEEMANRRTAALSRDVVGEDHRTLLEKMACEIANLALYNSFDRFADTPYARAARNAGRKHKGGKVDDITVIIACIR